LKLDLIARNIISVYYDALAVSAYIGQECTELEELGLDDQLHIVTIESVDLLINLVIFDRIIKGILVNKNGVTQCNLISLV
jgi:hypothetical protein